MTKPSSGNLTLTDVPRAVVKPRLKRSIWTPEEPPAVETRALVAIMSAPASASAAAMRLAAIVRDLTRLMGSPSAVTAVLVTRAEGANGLTDDGLCRRGRRSCRGG